MRSPASDPPAPDAAAAVRCRMPRRSPFVLVVACLLATSLAAMLPTASSAATGDLVGTANFSQQCGGFQGIGVGVTFDGTNLWYSCAQSTPDLFRADPHTGQVTASYTIGGGIGALAYDATHNVIYAGWGSSSNQGNIYSIQLDASRNVTGSAVKFTAPGAIVCGLDDGLAYDGSNDTLYVSDDCSTTIHHYDTSGNELGSFPWAGSGCYNSGLALGDQLIFEGADGCSTVYVVDKSAPQTVKYQFSTAVAGDPNFRDEGLSCDTSSFPGKDVMWSKEAYAPERAHAFEVPAGSCGVGGLPAVPTCAEAGQMENEQPESFDKWSLHWGISKCEGLVMSNVVFGDRLMAERMSLPYLEVQTCLSPSDIFHCQGNTTRHIVLRTNAGEAQSDPTAFTHVQLASDGVTGVRPRGGNCAGAAAKHVCEHISIHAAYRVDLAPPGTSGPYLLVTQNDEFYPAFSENKFSELACEPSKEAFPFGLIATPLDDCGRWKPIVKYSFHQGSGATVPTLLISVKAAARLHFTPDALAVRAGTFFRDCDQGFPEKGNCFPPSLNLLETYKPGQEERAASNEAIIRAYQFDGNPLSSTYAGRYDNLHMTPASQVAPPGPDAGCPECGHMHWRWGSDIFGPFNGTARSFYGEGQPLIGDGEPAAVPNPDAHQEMDVAMVAYHSQTNELAPYHFSDLVQGADLGQLRVGRNGDNFVGGFTSGSEKLEYPSGSCSDATDLASWGQCGEVAWLSATSYPYLSRDKSSDTFFAFGGFFCSTCSNGDYSEVIVGMAPTYRTDHHRTSGAVAQGETLTTEFSSLRGGVQLNDVLPSGLLNVSASYVELDGDGNPTGSSTPCPVAVDRVRNQVVECDLSPFGGSFTRFRITISALVSSTVTPGTYYNTVHAVWGAEHSNSRIGGNYKKTDAITILPGRKLGPGF
jgi:hypothetical protein